VNQEKAHATWQDVSLVFCPPPNDWDIKLPNEDVREKCVEYLKTKYPTTEFRLIKSYGETKTCTVVQCNIPTIYVDCVGADSIFDSSRHVMYWTTIDLVVDSGLEPAMAYVDVNSLKLSCFPIHSELREEYSGNLEHRPCGNLDCLPPIEQIVEHIRQRTFLAVQPDHKIQYRIDRLLGASWKQIQSTPEQ
jgi:hypothetical protein